MREPEGCGMICMKTHWDMVAVGFGASAYRYENDFSFVLTVFCGRVCVICS